MLQLRAARACKTTCDPPSKARKSLYSGAIDGHLILPHNSGYMRSLPGARLGLFIVLASTAACGGDDPSAPSGSDPDLWSFSQRLEITIPGIEQTCSDRGTWAFTQNGTALSGEISYLGTCAMPLGGGACVGDDCIEPGPRRFDDFDFLLLREGTTANRAVRFAATTRQFYCRYQGTLSGDPPTTAAGSIGCFSDEATTTALATGTWEASRGTPPPLPLGAVGAVTAGSEHSCALAAGRAYCWGGNLDGQLGIGDVVGRPLPTAVVVERSFSAISAGALHTCAIGPAGAAYCWGSARSGQLGDGRGSTDLLDPGLGEFSSGPVAVQGGLAFTAISAGLGHTCGIAATGAAYCWGSNRFGQLGDGTTTRRTTPTPVGGGLRFSSISSGLRFTCGIAAAAAHCWGINDLGQLGIGSTVSRSSPSPVNGGIAFTSIATGLGHACGLSTAGEAYCWGFNNLGQLGTGDSVSSTSPRRVVGGRTYASLTAGVGHTCAITTGGNAFCWGGNFDGELGTGNTARSLTPRAVAGGLTFTAIDAGAGHTCALTTGGVAYCWGGGTRGQLGRGPPSIDHSLVPLKVAGQP